MANEKQIRIACDFLTNAPRAVVDQMTDAKPFFYRANALRFDFAFFNGAALADTADIQKVELLIKPAKNGDVPVPTDSYEWNEIKGTDGAAAEIGALTLETWAAKSAQHITFALTPAQSVDIAEGEKWIVLAITYSDGAVKTFLAGIIGCIEDGLGATTPPETVSQIRDEIFQAVEDVQDAAQILTDNAETIAGLPALLEAAQDAKTGAEAAQSAAETAAADASTAKGGAETAQSNAESAASDAETAASEAAASAALALYRTNPTPCIQISSGCGTLARAINGGAGAISIFVDCDFASFVNQPIWQSNAWCGFETASSFRFEGTDTITLSEPFVRGDKLCAVLTPTSAKIYRNSTLVGSASTGHAYNYLSSIFGVYGGQLASNIFCSRFYVANFDASAGGAAYTPTDFANNRPVPLALKYGGIQFANDPTAYPVIGGGTTITGRVNAYATAYYALAYNAGKYRLTLSATLATSLMLRYRFNTPIPAGVAITTTIGASTSNKTGNTIAAIFGYTDGTSSGGYGLGTYAGGTRTDTLAKNVAEIYFSATVSGGTWEAADYVEFGNISVTCSGFELICQGAADYKQWRNAARNAYQNHVSLEGVVSSYPAPLEYTNSAVMSWAGTADTKYFISSTQERVPMYCRYIIYARSSAAINIDIGSESSTTTYASNVALTANTWAAVATAFKNGINNKTTITPKSTYTGVIEVMEKVELI